MHRVIIGHHSVSSSSFLLADLALQGRPLMGTLRLALPNSDLQLSDCRRHPDELVLVGGARLDPRVLQRLVLVIRDFIYSREIELFLKFTKRNDNTIHFLNYYRSLSSSVLNIFHSNSVFYYELNF